jgi:hypothetical protein
MVSGLLAPLMGVGLDEPGLVSRYLIMEKPRIMERD